MLGVPLSAVRSVSQIGKIKTCLYSLILRAVTFVFQKTRITNAGTDTFSHLCLLSMIIGYAGLLECARNVVI